MKKNNKRVQLIEEGLTDLTGGFLVPYFISRVVTEATIFLNKAVDWLTTEH